MNPFKVICIRDEGRPNEIPASKWVEKGHLYTVIKVSKMPMGVSQIGYHLQEVDITGYPPYTCFDSTRFAIPEVVERGGVLAEPYHF